MPFLIRRSFFARTAALRQMQPFEKALSLSSSGKYPRVSFPRTMAPLLSCYGCLHVFNISVPERVANFFPDHFFIFSESIFQIGENECKLGPITFPQKPPHLGDDPVGRRKPRSTRPTLPGARCHDLGSILTRISGSFGGVASELSQNGIWIRIIRNMESFQRPPRSVPRD